MEGKKTIVSDKVYIYQCDCGRTARIDTSALYQDIETLQRALAPIIRHAEAHEFAPPISFSVDDCRKIKEGLKYVCD